MGKGGGGTTPAGAMSGGIANAFSKLSGPSRNLYFKQLSEALTTGSIAKRAPIIQQMVERGLHEGSRAQDITTEGVAKLGGAAARSPAAAESLAAQQAISQRAVAAIPAQVVGAAASRGGADSLSAMNAANAFLGTAGIQQGQAQQAAAAQAATINSEIGAGVGVAVAVIAAI